MMEALLRTLTLPVGHVGGYTVKTELEPPSRRKLLM